MLFNSIDRFLVLSVNRLFTFGLAITNSSNESLSIQNGVIYNTAYSIAVLSFILLVLIVVCRSFYSYSNFNQLAKICIFLDLLAFISSLSFIYLIEPIKKTTQVLLIKLNDLTVFQSIIRLSHSEISSVGLMDDVDMLCAGGIIFLLPLFAFLMVLSIGSILLDVRKLDLFFSFTFVCFFVLYWSTYKVLPYSINMAQLLGQSFITWDLSQLFISAQQRLLRSSFILFFILIHSSALLDLMLEINNLKVVAFLSNLRSSIAVHTVWRRLGILFLVVYGVFIWKNDSVLYSLVNDVLISLFIALLSMLSSLEILPAVVRLIDTNGNWIESVNFKRGVKAGAGKQGFNKGRNVTINTKPSGSKLYSMRLMPDLSLKPTTHSPFPSFFKPVNKDTLMPQSLSEKHERLRGWTYHSMDAEVKKVYADKRQAYVIIEKHIKNNLGQYPAAVVEVEDTINGLEKETSLLMSIEARLSKVEETAVTSSEFDKKIHELRVDIKKSSEGFRVSDAEWTEKYRQYLQYTVAATGAGLVVAGVEVLSDGEASKTVKSGVKPVLEKVAVNLDLEKRVPDSSI